MMSQRILVAELKQESATFNPAPTRYDDFRIERGADLLSAYTGTETELSGVLDVLAEGGRFEVVPTIAAAAVSGGPIGTDDLDRLLDEILASVRAEAGDLAGVCLCLHGAMAGATESDPEGRLLADVRDIVGDVSVVATLDLHAVLTERMVENADFLVPYHTYPHTDHRSTGRRAARLLVAFVEGRVSPSVVDVSLPMLVRGDELLTATGRFGEAIRMCQALESSERGLVAGVLIGNAFTDVPGLQSHVLVATDGDPELARREAERIGRFMWDNRELFQATLTSLDESIRLANTTAGLTVFSDAADATASGASGDSNAILRGLLDSGFSKRALVPIVDAPAVERAHESGLGSEIVVSLGGTLDHDRFEPVSVPVRVKSLFDGEFLYEDGTLARAGAVAVLEAGSIDILTTSRSVYVVGRRVFEAHGLDPRHYDLVVVKSPNGFRTWYSDIASCIVPVDVPGSASANLRSLPFRHCERPIFPLDADVPSPFGAGP